MADIKPNLSSNHGDEFFDPMTGEPEDGTAVGIKPVCCCGYELVKEDNDVWRCIGGNHRYRMSEGEVAFDKFGQPLIKMPENFDAGSKE